MTPLNTKGLTRNGALAFIDQFTFSISSFLLVICLAKRAEPYVYATYIAVYTSIQAASSIQNSLVISPMAIFSLQYGSTYTRYLNSVTLPISALLGAIATFMYLTMFPHGQFEFIYPVSFCMSFIYLDQNYIRNQLKYTGNLSKLFLMDLYATLTELLAIIIFLLFFNISLLNLLIILTSQWITARLYFTFKQPATITNTNDNQLKSSWIKSHWIYGRWILLESAPFWVISTAPIWILSKYVGTISLEHFNTIFQLTGIFSLAFSSVQTGIISQLVSMRQAKGLSDFRSFMIRITPWFAITALIITIISCVILPKAVSIIYNTKQGADLTIPIIWMSITVGCSIISAPASIFYSITEDTRFGFVTVATKAIIILCLFAIPLARSATLNYVTMVIALSSITSTLLCLARFTIRTTPTVRATQC